MGPQSHGSPRYGNFETPIWKSWDKKNHLDVAPMERCIKYYKGDSGGLPQVRAVVSLVSPSCPWLVLAPKVLQLCTKHLVLVLCKFVWVVEACQFFLVPSQSSSTPLYPSKWYESGNVPQLLTLTLFSVKELRAHKVRSTSFSFIFFTIFLMFGYEPKLPTSIWRDAMVIINMDDLNVWIQTCE
jgi:hypothetical protein